MSNKKKEEIDLNVSTDVSDDEFEDLDGTLTDDENEDNQEENENNQEELEEDSINENFENDNEENNSKKISYEESFTKSEIEKNTLTDTFLDEEDDLDDDASLDLDLTNYESNENLQVPDDQRISKNILTKYEIVRIIGTRAKQISDGSKIFVKYDGNKSSIELAELELKHKVIPLKIKRPLPNGKFEIWKLSELELLDNI